MEINFPSSLNRMLSAMHLKGMTLMLFVRMMSQTITEEIDNFSHGDERNDGNNNTPAADGPDYTAHSDNASCTTKYFKETSDTVQDVTRQIGNLDLYKSNQSSENVVDCSNTGEHACKEAISKTGKLNINDETDGVPILLSPEQKHLSRGKTSIKFNRELYKHSLNLQETYRLSQNTDIDMSDEEINPQTAQSLSQTDTQQLPEVQAALPGVHSNVQCQNVISKTKEQTESKASLSDPLSPNTQQQQHEQITQYRSMQQKRYQQQQHASSKQHHNMLQQPQQQQQHASPKQQSMQPQQMLQQPHQQPQKQIQPSQSQILTHKSDGPQHMNKLTFKGNEVMVGEHKVSLEISSQALQQQKEYQQSHLGQQQSPQTRNLPNLKTPQNQQTQQQKQQQLISPKSNFKQNQHMVQQPQQQQQQQHRPPSLFQPQISIPETDGPSLMGNEILFCGNEVERGVHNVPVGISNLPNLGGSQYQQTQNYGQNPAVGHPCQQTQQYIQNAAVSLQQPGVHQQSPCTQFPSSNSSQDVSGKQGTLTSHKDVVILYDEANNEPEVKAFQDHLLKHVKLQPPLTVEIFGEVGLGKSEFRSLEELPHQFLFIFIFATDTFVDRKYRFMTEILINYGLTNTEGKHDQVIPIWASESAKKNIIELSIIKGLDYQQSGGEKTINIESLKKLVTYGRKKLS